VVGAESLTIEKVEFESEEVVKEFWSRRENGDECFDLFLQLKAKYATLKASKLDFDAILK